MSNALPKLTAKQSDANSDTLHTNPKRQRGNELTPSLALRVSVISNLGQYRQSDAFRVATIKIAVALCVMLVWHSVASADKPVAPAELAVDQVSIKGGPRILGSVLGREADGTLAVAVGRDWLKKAHLQFFEKTLPAETAETRAALIELRDRIVEWRRARSPENQFDFFLKKESERLEQTLKAIDAGTYDENAPLMVLDLAPAKIDRVVNQPPQRKRVALTAWREKLADVETRSTNSLVQELKKLKVDPVDEGDFLFELLPPRRQNESAWAARQAIVEYHYLQPLDFQGRGDLVLRAGQQINAANAGQLFGDLLKSLGGDPIGNLLGPAGGNAGKKAIGRQRPENWLDSATKIADVEKVAGLRVTRSEEDLAARRVAVETRFVARMPDGSWKTVWQRAETADAAKVRADVEQQIMQDPQIRAALDLVKSFGLGGDEQVKMAVRFGAATQEAQKQADSRFFEFRDRHLQRLDSPVLRVAPAAAAKATK